MKWIRVPRGPLAKAAAALALACSAVVLPPILSAATPAGQQIKNLATVTYEDANGNVFSAQSAEAIVTVAQVYSATIGVDVDASAVAGQTVNLAYLLTNTGNGTDTYELTATNTITGGDSIDATNITIYHDVNGNGEPDGSEPVISSATLPANTVVLPPGTDYFMNIVVAVDVPNTAADGQTLGITLEARARNGGATGVVDSVTDVSPGQGRDGEDGTNESLITVTGNAIIDVSKTLTHDVASSQITYTLTVNNTGNRPAQEVVIFDGLPEGTTLVPGSVSASGLLASNDDTIATTALVLDETTLPVPPVTGPIDLNGNGNFTDSDETTLGLDLNNNGVATESGLTGVYAVDALLPVNGSVSLTFTVQYDPATLGAGAAITNVGHASSDTNESGTSDNLVSSNTRVVTVNASYGVTITDTQTGSNPGVNDGGDDSAVADVQHVDEIAAGGTVIFTTIVTNNGNANDTFELSVAPGNFPPTTVFTFYDSSGNVVLTDTNGSGIDTGEIGGGASSTIIVKAVLPAGASGAPAAPATAYEAVVTATSSLDTASPAASDTVTISLGNIIEAIADLHNTNTGTAGVDDDPLGTAPYSAANTYATNAGTTVNIPLFIDNDSGSADSFLLTSGSSWDGSVLGAMHAGWTVAFYEADAGGNPVGPELTSTPLIPGNTTNFPMVAVVTVPSDAAQAMNDLLFDNNGDGTATRLDDAVTGDGDGDYPLFFQITSSGSGATDIVLDAIDVNDSREVSLVNPGNTQVQAGGQTGFSHTLSNTGNVDESLELTVSNSQALWSSTVSIDTDGDGVADTLLENLTAGNIIVEQPDGSDVTIAVTISVGGNPVLTLPQGAILPLTAVVFSPTTALAGESNVLTITATNTDAGGPSATVTDQVTIVNSSVTITKEVAVDVGCNGTLESGFALVQATPVAPGDCAVWRVIAENTGPENAQKVVISDSVPAFSTYLPGSLKYCENLNCAPQPIGDIAADGDAGVVTGSNINFYVGTGANPVAATGGELLAGDQATAEFTVTVD